MKARAALVFSLLACSACAGSPTAPAPAPILPAQIAATGSLFPSTCFSFSNTILECEYSGSAVNNGTGCALNVRGSTLAYDSNKIQIGASQWTYIASIVTPVRPGERFVYSGFSLHIPANNGTWTYNTQVTWDNTRCP